MVVPRGVRTVHLTGIAGTGMGAFAGLLKQAGYIVRGSDEGVYPPMSVKLDDWGISVRTPYAAENLLPPVDLVVIGNVIRKVNPEAAAALASGRPVSSFPETLGALFLNERHSIVVAGTHGKTTTTTLIAHVLKVSGRDPGYLVGGIPLGFEESFRVGKKGGPFVVEGDEYDTAFFDKGPKFLHYRPRSLLVTSIEYDHADIYASVEDIERRFTELFNIVPDDGAIVVRGGAFHIERALKAASSKTNVQRYGPDGDWQAASVVVDPRGQTFDVVFQGASRGPLFIPMHGPHGIENALGAYAILDGFGLSHDEIHAGMSSFGGVKRRMEVRGEEDNAIVVDDFAHHPTAIKVTLEGARARWPDHRLIALFEPRSATSCRRVFQEAFATAFDAADDVILAPTGRKLDPEESLDVGKLRDDVIARGKSCVACASLDDVVAEALRPTGPRVLLMMSNGAFGDVHGRVLRALAERAP